MHFGHVQVEILMSLQQSSLSFSVSPPPAPTLNTSNDDQNSCKKEMRTKLLNIFLHSTLPVSLNCHMQLYTVSLCFMTSTSRLCLPLSSTFIVSLPLFAAFHLSCKAKTNGFAGAQRGCQLAVPEVIWYAEISSLFPFHSILFCKLSH